MAPKDDDISSLDVEIDLDGLDLEFGAAAGAPAGATQPDADSSSRAHRASPAVAASEIPSLPELSELKAADAQVRDSVYAGEFSSPVAPARSATAHFSMPRPRPTPGSMQPADPNHAPRPAAARITPARMAPAPAHSIAPQSAPAPAAPGNSAVRSPSGTMAFSLRDELNMARSSFGTSSQVPRELVQPAQEPSQVQADTSPASVMATREVEFVTRRESAQISSWPSKFLAGRRGTTSTLLAGSRPAPTPAPFKAPSFATPAAGIIAPHSVSNSSIDLGDDDDDGFASEPTQQVEIQPRRMSAPTAEAPSVTAPEPADQRPVRPGSTMAFTPAALMSELGIGETSADPERSEDLSARAPQSEGTTKPSSSGQGMSEPQPAEAAGEPEDDSQELSPRVTASSAAGSLFAGYDSDPFVSGGESSREIDLEAMEQAAAAEAAAEAASDGAPKVRAEAVSGSFFAGYEEDPISFGGESSREIDLAAMEGIDPDAPEEPLQLKEIPGRNTTGSNRAVTGGFAEVGLVNPTTGSNPVVSNTGRRNAVTGSSNRALSSIPERNLSPPERKTPLSSHLVMAVVVIAVILGAVTGAVALGFFDPDKAWLEGVPFLYDFWMGLYPG